MHSLIFVTFKVIFAIGFDGERWDKKSVEHGW